MADGSGRNEVNVPFDDLRGWIEEADRLGELKRANGYNWEEQIGWAAEILQHDDVAPVAVFDQGDDSEAWFALR